jgi:FdhE protein
MDTAARRRWLVTHPFLLPVARFDEAVSRALDAPAPAQLVAQPDWDAYLADFHVGVPLLRSAAAGVRAAPAVAELLSDLVARLAVDEELLEPVRTGCRNLAESFRSQRSQALAAAGWILVGGADRPPPSDAGLVQALGWSAAVRVLAPIVATFAERREESRWGRGLCPTCGALPVMGLLVPGEGVRERQLSCGLCSTRWTFRRIGCPYCGNEDSGRLSILEVGEDGDLRLDLCAACRGYTKTWTGEGDPTLLLADWTSLHLDMLAGERGYQRKGASRYQL